MVSLEVKDSVTRALHGLESDLLNTRRAWRPVSDEIFSIRRAQFNTAGKRGGTPWAPLKVSTVSAIRRANLGGVRHVGLPGRASDRMFLALTTRGAPGGVYEERNDELVMGVDVRSARGFPYPVAFTKGTKFQPPRPVDVFTPGDQKRLASLFMRSFREPIRDRGFDYRDDGGEAAF
jgi:hypothetical protein